MTPEAANGSPNRYHEWSLAQLIDVACEVGLLRLDIKKCSYGLPDFRNYFHSHQRLISDFTPDEHTAKVCFQFLNTILASLAGKRQ